jgi:hypothetical protein
VTDVHPNTIDFNDDFFAQAGLARRIGVAENSFDRRDQAELVQNAESTDISGVKNELDTRQCLVHAGPKQPVRVGD